MAQWFVAELHQSKGLLLFFRVTNKDHCAALVKALACGYEAEQLTILAGYYLYDVCSL
jgi:hypothetical protein